MFSVLKKISAAISSTFRAVGKIPVLRTIGGKLVTVWQDLILPTVGEVLSTPANLISNLTSPRSGPQVAQAALTARRLSATDQRLAEAEARLARAMKAPVAPKPAAEAAQAAALDRVLGKPLNVDAIKYLPGYLSYWIANLTPAAARLITDASRQEVRDHLAGTAGIRGLPAVPFGVDRKRVEDGIKRGRDAVEHLRPSESFR